MQTSRLLISTLTALTVVGIGGYAVAQTSTTTGSGAVTTTTPGGTTTITPPSVTTTETEAERMNRERMNANTTSGATIPSTSTSEADRLTRERMERERLSAPAATDRMDQSTGSAMDRTARRDADGNLIARADRN